MNSVLTSENLSTAYSQGYFPMADERGEIGWYSVHQRALFPMTGLHVSKSLGKVLRREVFTVTFDQAFESVMRGCIRPLGNWLTDEFVVAYTRCHQEGWGHSCEVWYENELVGGVYGLALGGCFCAESMFHRKTDASKVALYFMIQKCAALGFSLFDAQIMNPHLASLGAFEVPSRVYLHSLQEALMIKTDWSREG